MMAMMVAMVKAKNIPIYYYKKKDDGDGNSDDGDDGDGNDNNRHLPSRRHCRSTAGILA